MLLLQDIYATLGQATGHWIGGVVIGLLLLVVYLIVSHRSRGRH